MHIKPPEIAGEHISGYEEHGYRPPLAIPTDQIPGATHHGGRFTFIGVQTRSVRCPVFGHVASRRSVCTLLTFEHYYTIRPCQTLKGLGLQGAESDPMPPAGTQEAKKYHMAPHLQLQCGPMLRYDTVDTSGIYHAFAMIVVADAGSDLSQTPYLSYRYTPNFQTRQNGNGYPNNNNGMNDNSSGQEVQIRSTAQKLWTFHGLAGPNSFWRMKFEIRLSDTEMKVHYSVNGGKELAFYVPARHQNMRWVGHSCNGFSAGKPMSDFLLCFVPFF